MPHARITCNGPHRNNLMDWDIRPMREQDIPAVSTVETAALGLSATDARNPDFLRIVLGANAGSCFVATMGDTVCGVVATQRHGVAGIIGLIAVTPDCAGKGIAGALVDHAVAALSPKVEFVGVQIPPECCIQSSLMLKHGFQFVEPQLVMKASVTDVAARQPTQNVKGAWRDLVGLTEWGTTMAEAKLGGIIKVGDEAESAGAAIAELVSRRTGAGKTSLVLSVGGAWRTLGGDPLCHLLTKAADKAAQHKRTTLFLAINGFYQRELNTMLTTGWTAVKLSQRLVLAKTLSKYRQFMAMPQVDLTQWTI